MKRFLLALLLVCGGTSSSFSKEYKLNVKNDGLLLNSEKGKTVSSNSFVLMSPVKLTNPEKVSYGFDAGAPKLYDASVFVKVPKKVKSVEPKVKEEKITPVVNVKESFESKAVVEPKTLNTPVVANDTIASDKKDDKQVEENVKLDKKPEEKNASDVENVAKEMDKQVSVSQTDKNIDEAKKLLEVAENLAKSVAQEAEKSEKSIKADVSNKDKVVSDIKKELNKNKKESGVVADSGKFSNFSVKFNSGDENLKDADINNLKVVADKIIGNADVNIKIISYYNSVDDRNVAFSRLLNTRKVLLEKNVPTSQIMIMVLEDSSKSNIVDVLFE